MEYTCSKNISTGMTFNEVTKDNLIKMKESIEEIHAHLQTLNSNSLLTIAYTNNLVNIDTSQNEIEDEDILALKTNVLNLQEYLKQCITNWSADNGAYQSADFETHDATVNAGDKVGYNTSYNSTDNSTQNNAVDVSDKSTVNATNCGTNNSTQNSTVNLSDNATNNSSEYNIYKSSVNSTVNASNYTSVAGCTTNKSSHVTTVYSVNKYPVANSAVFSTNNSSVKSSNLTSDNGTYGATCPSYTIVCTTENGWYNSPHRCSGAMNQEGGAGCTTDNSTQNSAYDANNN